MMPLSKPADRDAHATGFTLLEALVALSLFALIAVIMLGGIRGGRQALERATISGRDSAIDSAQNLLRDLITEIRPIPLAGANIGTPVLMDGARDRIKFISSFTVEGQYAGLYASSLRVIAHQGGPGLGDLVLSQQLFRPATSAGRGESVWNTTLVSNVSAIRLRYYGALLDGTQPEWWSGWTRYSALPMVVEIAITLSSADERPLRSIVVPLVFAE